MRVFNLRKAALGSMSWSILSTITILSTLLSLSSLTPSSLVSAAPNTPGFCGDCQTFSNAITPCGATFTKTDIEISGTYIPPQSAAKCICTEVLQKVLWNCARCELLAGFDAHSQPPQAYQTQCIGWGMVQTEWKAPYTGVVAPGTSTPLTGGTNPQPPAGTSGSGSNPTTGGATGGGSASGTGSMPDPSGGSTADGGSGPNGTAIGISVGIIGVAIVAGIVSMFMIKRRRNRRHAPLELGDHYVGMDDHQWEKPSRPQSPMIPATVASGAPVASRGPMQAPHRPSPFESRPGGGGSVVGGYDGQYDQYEPYGHGGGGGGGGGYETYSNHGGYDPNYRQGPPQGYPSRDYAYEHAMPTSGTPLPPYHGGKSEGGHYM
ncbi:hypothetical protein BGZ75_008524 [Mortierella antarctica]|nr:hypothetical protein BGZ67_004681 [Mortierella alpina]KAF9988789.1 hypothetical protein BGZ75_008524 [Mortierella antarctica]